MTSALPCPRPAPLDVERLARALMWCMEVDPCDGVTWGTDASANELAAAIAAVYEADQTEEEA